MKEKGSFIMLTLVLVTRVGFLMGSMLLMISCRSENVAEPYTDLSLKEKAREALDHDEYGEAIALYKQWISEHPQDYESYRFLSAAYAAAGGFSIFNAIKGLAETAGESASVSDLVSSLVPLSPDDEQMAMLASSIDQILAMPATYRDVERGESEGVKSTALQLSLYRTAYAMMILNRYTSSVDAASNTQPRSVEDMSEIEVDLLINNLKAASVESGNGTIENSLKATISAIENQEGSSQKEKLANYVNTR